MCLLTDYDSFDFKETLNMLDSFKERVWIECNVQMGFNLDSERKELDEDFDFTKRILNDFLLMKNLLEKNIDLKKEKIDPEQIKRCFDIVLPMADYSLKNKGLYDKDVTKTVSNIEKICRKIYEKNSKSKKQKDIEL